MIGNQMQKDSKIDQNMLYKRGSLNEIKFKLDLPMIEYIKEAERKHNDAKSDLAISLQVVGNAPLLNNVSFFSQEEINRSLSLKLSRQWFQAFKFIKQLIPSIVYGS